MKKPTTFARILSVASSLALLAAYVWHSQTTPNTPPPDPLGLNAVELTLEPEVVEFDRFIDYGTPISADTRPTNEQESGLRGFWQRLFGSHPSIPAPVTDPSPQSHSDLRIITTKTISQPIFSVHEPSPWKRPIMPSSKSAPIEISRHSFRLNEGLKTFDLFGQQPSTRPAP